MMTVGYRAVSGPVRAHAQCSPTDLHPTPPALDPHFEQWSISCSETQFLSFRAYKVLLLLLPGLSRLLSWRPVPSSGPEGRGL